MDEFELIRRFFDRDQPGVDIGIGDDAAVVSVPAGHQLVVAVDTLVAGVHFPETMTAEDVGYRAAAVNLSDMAAMGADPRWATLALTLPDTDAEWLTGFAAGLFESCGASGVSLIGGDTTRGPLTVSVQMLGLVPDGAALRRGGARVGDVVAVTGILGEAGAGLRALLGELECDAPDRDALVQRFLRPEPRLREGQAIASWATSCIDVSDGLVADLGHICKASGVAATIDATRLPVSSALRDCIGVEAARHLALTAGDDYELCFTLDPDDVGPLPAWATIIGRIEAGTGVRVHGLASPIARGAGGFRHFTDGEGA